MERHWRPADRLRGMLPRSRPRRMETGETLGLVGPDGRGQSTLAVDSVLFATSPRDAETFVLAPSILTLVAVQACWFAALRATRIDPAVAPRDE